jgi:protein-S-isoprenylcysteine O-methyltransferase Ste14
MDTARYVLALVTLVGLVPGFLLWFFIHPVAGFWRRLGPVGTYAILSVPVVALMAAVFLARDVLLAREYGTRLPLVVLGLLCLVPAGLIAGRRRRQLTFGILAGVPELSPDQGTRKLLTEGIYGTIRHPRYVELMFWLLGYALIANYLALYVAVVTSIPLLWLVVVLEERELRQRFGSEYEAYARKVPRFVPSRMGRMAH